MRLILDILYKIKPVKRAIALVSLVVPRDPELIVFGSGSGQFTDNPKYLFLEMHHETTKRAIWITENKEVVEKLREEGFESYKTSSWKAKYYSLRSQYVFFDHGINDVHSWYVVGSKTVNLWHGFPYKKLGVNREDREYLDEKSMIERVFQVFREHLYESKYYLYTTEGYESLFSSGSLSKPIYAGYPRNDIFKHNIRGCNLGSIDIEGSYVVYLPTFRQKRDFEDILDLEKIDGLLDKNEIDFKLVVKPHPWQEISDSSYRNIKILESEIDIYPVLCDSKALITDYSSVMFDYMYTDNPIIRFAFDKEEYNEERGLYTEVEHLIPGEEVKTMNELINQLSSLGNIDPDYEDKIEEVFRSRKKGLQAKHILNQIKDS